MRIITTPPNAIANKYAYVYDGLNRLLAGFFYKQNGADFQFSGEHNEILTYDANGNIQTLKRYAYKKNLATAPLFIDDLHYGYIVTP